MFRKWREKECEENREIWREWEENGDQQQDRRSWRLLIEKAERKVKRGKKR